MTLNLMSRGRSTYVIAVPENAAPEIAFAASELQHYLQRIGGAELPITQAAAPSRALVLKTTLRSTSPDAFTIETRANRLIFNGASPRGVLYAVYTFLEECLGCAWLRPGDEHVPSLDAITIEPLAIAQEPTMRDRILTHFNYFRDRALEQIDWMAKRKLNVSFIAVNHDLDIWDSEQTRERILPELRKRGIELRAPGHSFFAWLPPEEYFTKHPDYFSLKGGERVNDKFVCVSNPGVARAMAKNIARFADANPELKVIALWHTDLFEELCECEACRALAEPELQSLCFQYATDATEPGMPGAGVCTTATELTLVNAVAEQLEKTHPDLLIETLAYGPNLQPSKRVQPRHNVLAGVAVFDKCVAPDLATTPLTRGRAHQSTRSYVRGWRKQAEHFYIYEYYGLFHDFTPLWGAMSKDYKWYRSLGVDGIASEIAGWNDVHMYMFAALAWNCDEPWPKILRRYCDGAYGAAADSMYQHWMQLQKAGLNWNWTAKKYRRATAHTPLSVLWAERQAEPGWHERAARCRTPLRQASELLRVAPLGRRRPSARGEEALARVRQVQARWEEVPLPWWLVRPDRV